MGLRHTSPAYLLNCAAPDAPTYDANAPTRSVNEIQAWTYETLTESQLAQVREQREIECDLRRQYLNTSFTDLIMELQDKLVEYQQLELLGDDDAKRGVGDTYPTIEKRKDCALPNSN
jgi:hypothetical protein